MTREQLAHVLRAAARIANDAEILVIGSQAILGSHSEGELPEVAWMSVEADLVFLDPTGGAEKAEEIDGAIGELSQFHETFSYYLRRSPEMTRVCSPEMDQQPTKRRGDRAAVRAG
jgi:hypothetical protein